MAAFSAEEIADIYEGATDAEGFAQLMGVIGRLMAVDTVGLWMIERGSITDIALSQNIVESSVPYLGYYQHIDPWRRSSIALNSAYLGTDTVSEKTLAASEFYNDFARHYGMWQPLGVVLGSDMLNSTTLALNRDTKRQPLDDVDKARLEAMLPHLGGALALRRRLQGGERRGERRLSQALDHLDMGVAITSARGELRYFNQAAEDLARAGLGLRLGRLRSTVSTFNGADNGRLLAAIARTAEHRTPFALHLAGQGTGGVSLLLTPAAGLDQTGGEVFIVYRALASAGLNETVLAALFGLSPAQASLCHALMNGQSFEEAAQARGIAFSTARTHFKAILAKTGASDLRDLLRLATRLPPPLR